MDTHSREEIVTTVLWGSLQSPDMMDGYMRYVIENHP